MAYVISELNLERQKLLAEVLAPVTDRLLQCNHIAITGDSTDCG